MKNIAFIFPGQGSQSVGMARGLYDNFPCVQELFTQSSDILGRDMNSLIFDGPEDELNLTRNAQTALMVANQASLLVLKAETGIEPIVVAGHSLGEYSALVASGALAFDDTLRLVDHRGKYMQEAVEVGVGGMCAVLGLDVDKIDEICDEVSTPDNLVVTANINCPGQVVISGHTEAVARASEKCLAVGAMRAVILKVSVPSHSPLMSEAAQRLSDDLAALELKVFDFPVVTNVEALSLSDPSRIAGLLTDQLTSRVRWSDSVLKMREMGAEVMLEVGPGKVLSTLLRRIDRGIKSYSAAEPASIEVIIEAKKPSSEEA